MNLRIHIDEGRIEAFCREHHIVKLSLFGSVLTDRFSPNSDVDVLVEFAPDHIPGLLALCAMESELSAILGRKADVRTAEDLSRYFREQVVNTAIVQYAS